MNKSQESLRDQLLISSLVLKHANQAHNLNKSSFFFLKQLRDFVDKLVNELENEEKTLGNNVIPFTK